MTTKPRHTEVEYERLEMASNTLANVIDAGVGGYSDNYRALALAHLRGSTTGANHDDPRG